MNVVQAAATNFDTLRMPSTNTSLKEMNSFLSTRNERARKFGETSVYLASSRLATIAKTRNTADVWSTAAWANSPVTDATERATADT